MSILYKFPFNHLRHNFIIGLHLQHIVLKSTNIDVIDTFTKNLTENKIIKWQIFYTKLNQKEELNDENVNNSGDGSIFNMIISSKNSTKEDNKYEKRQNNSNSNNLIKMNDNTKKIVQNVNNFIRYPIEKKNDENQININNENSNRLNRLKLDKFIRDKLNENNDKNEIFNVIMEKLMKHKLVSSHDILICLLKELSLKGYTNYIDDIEILFCNNKNNEKITNEICMNLLIEEFNSFRGMSLWKNGKIDNALNILLNSYKIKFHDYNKNNNVNKCNINIEYLHWIFKNMIDDTVSKKSEAVLINLINIANIIYNNYNDIHIISWIWKKCFDNEWYSNQKIAMKLFLNNEELRNLIYKRSSSLCFTFLQNNSIDAVYRLIELYLKFDQKESCKHCLNQLFLYQYWRKDYRSCSEIIKTSKELNIQLNENQNKKLFNIIMERTNGKYNTIRETKQFKYKF